MQHTSLFAASRCGAQRRQLMVKVKIMWLHVHGLREVKVERQAWIEGPEKLEGRPWVADTWWFDKCKYMKELIMLTKSRRRLTKSSGGVEDMVIGRSKTNGDTCWDHGGSVSNTLLTRGLVVWTFKSPGGQFWVWASKLELSSSENWRQHEEASRSSHRHEAISWKIRGRRIYRSWVGR